MNVKKTAQAISQSWTIEKFKNNEPYQQFYNRIPQPLGESNDND